MSGAFGGMGVFPSASSPPLSLFAKGVRKGGSKKNRGLIIKFPRIERGFNEIY